MIVVESEQLLDYIMVRTGYFLMKWWGYLFCTRSTHWVRIYTVVLSHIKSNSHIQTTLLHSDMCIIPTPNQPICDLTLLSCMFTGGEANAKFIVFGLQEWVGDCCLTPSEQFSIYIVAKT